MRHGETKPVCRRKPPTGKLCRLDQARREPEFHRDSESATAEIPESDRLVKTLSRLDQLHENVETLKGSVYEG